MKLNKLSIDTETRKILLDGKPLDTVTEISFLWNTKGDSTVTITADVDIHMDTEIFGDIFEEIYCPKCGLYLGKINLNGRIYGMRCPHCGGSVDITAPRE